MRFYNRPAQQLIIPGNAGPNDPQIDIGSQIPPELVSFYAARTAGLAGTITGGTLYRANANDYEYQILVQTATGPYMSIGRVDLDVSPSVFVLTDYARTASPDRGLVLLGGVGALVAPEISIEGNLTFSGLSAPRGTRPSHGRCVAGSVASSAGAEVAIPAASWATEPFLSIPDNRLYEAAIQIRVQPSAATESRIVLRLRQGSATTSGTELSTFVLAIPSVANGDPCVFNVVAYFRNTTGATVVTAFSLTNQRGAGAANVALFGDAGIPIRVVFKDLGDVSQQTGLVSATSVTP